MKRSVNGLLVLDKPPGITSRNAINQASRWFPRRTRIGHAGTLDPLATGVLVLCLGSATRLADYVQILDKTYQATVLLGMRSDTDDVDGTITHNFDARPVDESTIRSAIDTFIGEVEQTPPRYSAIKINGKRAHELARRGETVDIDARQVAIHGIVLKNFAWPALELEVHCGKGTYIRSLARDLGDKLGCGAVIKQLRRTRIGHFSTDNSVTLDASSSVASEHLLPLLAAVEHLPRFVANETEIDVLRHGQPVQLPDGLEQERKGEIVAVDGQGRFIGIGKFESDGMIWPVKTFPVEC